MSSSNGTITISRRSFLLCSLFSLTLRPTLLFAGIVPSISDKLDDRLDALTPFVDTLLPEHLGPSASSLGIDRLIKEAVLNNKDYARLLMSGCHWLETVSRQNGLASFRVMPEDLKIRVVAAAEDADGTLAQLFFRRVRDDAFRLYYSRPEGWSYTGAPGAPQPAGFMDFAVPPQRERPQ